MIIATLPTYVANTSSIAMGEYFVPVIIHKFVEQATSCILNNSIYYVSLVATIIYVV